MANRIHWTKPRRDALARSVLALARLSDPVAVFPATIQSRNLMRDLHRTFLLTLPHGDAGRFCSIRAPYDMARRLGFLANVRQTTGTPRKGTEHGEKAETIPDQQSLPLEGPPPMEGSDRLEAWEAFQALGRDLQAFTRTLDALTLEFRRFNNARAREGSGKQTQKGS